MKAKYVKPDLLVESFTLMQNIANTCAGAAGSTLGHPTFGDGDNCGWSLGGAAILWAHAGACDDLVEPNTEVSGICYNNPNGGLSIFGS